MTSCSAAAGSSSSLARDGPEELVPVARVAAARPVQMPGVRRGRLSARVVAGARALPRPARAPLRPGAGVVEGEERLPWRGRAGQTLRRWLQLPGDELYATFYCASVTRCYPGRPSSGRGDRTPTPREQELCEFWRDWELELLRPELIVTVGGLALRRLLGIAHADRRDRQELHTRRCDRDPAPAPVRSQRLAERPRRTAPGSARR